jgi:hypothetical protein
MKLYFARAELLLQRQGDEYVLSMGGEVLGKFKRESRAVAEFNRVRRELEAKLPPTEPTQQDKEAIFAKFIAENLIGRNLSDKKRKPNKSRTFG